MSELKHYTKKTTQPMFPWFLELDMEGVSISDYDLLNGSPKEGDMIAINPQNPSDLWLVSKDAFEVTYTESVNTINDTPKGYALVPIEPTEEMIKALIKGVNYGDAYKAMIKAAGEHK